MNRVFIAGPMSGYPEWNYPAFDDAANRIKASFKTATVYNPADNHDRRTDLPRWMYIEKTLSQLRGLAKLNGSGASLVVVLDGWTKSKGARLEVEAAHQLGIEIYPLECMLDPHWESTCRIIPSLPTEKREGCPTAEPAVCEIPHETISDEDRCEAERLERARVLAKQPVRAETLDEAKRLICGDRNAQYGPPTQDFSRTADILNALGYRLHDSIGAHSALQPSDIAIIMVALKTSRLMHSRAKRDSWVDLAGYAGCGAECAEEADE